MENDDLILYLKERIAKLIMEENKELLGYLGSEIELWDGLCCRNFIPKRVGVMSVMFEGE